MNQLLERFGTGLVVLAFPCNQFGHQENSSGEEILSSLRFVRPGNNFESKAELFSKVDVNGSTAHPVFQFLKEKLPLPSDDCVSLIGDPKFIIWSPVRRSDIGWNFEKFLVDTKGTPVMRYSKCFETMKIADDIQKLL